MSRPSLPLEGQLPHVLPNCTLRQLTQITALAITTALSHRSSSSISLILRRTTELTTMDSAHRLFSSSPPHLLLHNAMIRGYSHHGPHHKSLHLFHQMPLHDLTPNSFTYPYVFNSCTHLKDHITGRKVHCRVVKAGFQTVPPIGSSLFRFYIKMGEFADGRRVFDGLVMKSVGLWNMMVTEFVHLGDIVFARRLFDEMPERDVVSWNTMVSGYGRAMDVESAGELFNRMPAKDVVSWTSMVRAYAGVGDVRAARRLFDQMPGKNVVSWNCMLSGYTQHGMFEQALKLFFGMMQRENVIPDGFTFVSALSACAHVGDLETGKRLHFHLLKQGVQLGAKVGTALVEMYAKCGDVDRAFRIFIDLPEKDVFCWNVMIKELGIHGRVEDALKLFAAMKREGLRLNDLTFMSVLLACAHGQFVAEARKIFSSMERDFNIQPNVKHYSCLVDLLCRGGFSEEALQLVKKMPYILDISIWAALVRSSKVTHDIDLVEKVLEGVATVETNEQGAYME